MIIYTLANTAEELQQILDLQEINLQQNLSSDEKDDQGFLSVQHDIASLKSISGNFKHIIAKDNGTVVGFAMVMLKDYKDLVPLMVPMFNFMDGITYKGKLLSKHNYFVMGQICIDKNYRGKGIFAGLYEKLRFEMCEDFDLVITEVDVKNYRSTKAHQNVGFKKLSAYVSPENQEWAVVCWDWNN
jgi:hypothetical protein